MKQIYLVASKRANWIPGILFTLLILLSTSCKKDIYDEFDQGINTPVSITANRDTVNLFEKDFDKEAIALTWTSGSNFGTNSSIAYKVLVDKEGNNFQNAVVEDLGKSAFTKKYLVKDLNNILVNRLSLTPGVEAGIEFKVITTVSGNAQSDSTTKVIRATPYQPVTTSLFLIGDAAPNGWNADEASALTLNGVIPGRFAWQGRLSAGEFKFITTKGSFSPSYTKGATNTQLFYRTADTQPDDKFVISTGGLYTINVNILDMSITIAEGNAPAYEQLWVVGDATPNGWNIENPNPMRVDRSNPFVFTFNEVLKAGSFKIPTSKGNWGTDYYMPLVNHQDLNLTDVQLTPGGNPDNQWSIASAGAYKIRLDLETMKINIKPFTPPTQLWLVGDATPNGWDIGAATPMVADGTNPYIFTYTGAIKAGEFKIPLQKDFAGDYYMPVIANEDATSSEMKFVPGGNPDNKWKISSEQAGNYKITIDVLHETINFEKL